MPRVSRQILVISVAVGVLAVGAVFVEQWSRGTQAVVTEKGEEFWPVTMGEGGEEFLPVTMGEAGERALQGKFVPGDVIVKFRDRASVGRAAAASVRARSQAPSAEAPPLRQDLDGLLLRHKVQKSEKIFQAPFRQTRSPTAPSLSVAPQSANRVAALEDSFQRYVKLEAEIKTKEATLALIEDLKTLPEVESAEPNYIVELFTVPNDSYYATSGAWGQKYRDLWGLQNIQAEPAWEVSQGEGVTVAVIDTGIDLTHEDIVQNVWTNPGEVGQCSNGIDDDGNGYIDDCWGWNFDRNDNNPMDDHGHGTHVAGTIAAVGNNGKGIIGVAPKAKVMALKGLDKDGSGYIDRLAQAIVYAADNGAKVINASWGGWVDQAPQVLVEAIDYIHDGKDVVFVAAAGNSNDLMYRMTPAHLPDVITVAASDHLDRKAPFSNYGTKIDVTAPGGGDRPPPAAYETRRSILSLKAAKAGDRMTHDGKLVIGGNYLRQAGTSMAAPHVAGVAALARSLHPEWTAEQVRQAIRMGADDVGTPGFDIYTGYGRVNARKAVLSMPPLFRPACTFLRGPTKFDVGDGKPMSMTMNDFNVDGKQDLAVANSGRHGSVAVLLGNGAGDFGPPTHFMADQWNLSVTTADFNGDQRPDLATADGGKLWVLLGDGMGGFGPVRSIDISQSAYDVIAQDFNGDAKPDLVVTHYQTSTTFSVLLGDGMGGFGPARSVSAGGHVRGILAQDFNGDAKLDLVMTFANDNNKHIALFLGTGGGDFLKGRKFQTGKKPRSITTADFNMDQRPDLAVANQYDATVSVLFGDGAGGFGPATNLPIGFVPLAVTARDFNGDTQPDLVVESAFTHHIALFLGNGAGGFGPATNLTWIAPTSWHIWREMTVHDFNLDAQPDLARGNPSDDAVTVFLLSCVSSPPPPPPPSSSSSSSSSPPPSSSSSPVCGNGALEPGEVCDQGDGNGQPHICCSSTCQLKENGTACDDDGNPCTTDTCNGSNVFCQHPADNAGAICRTSVGPCDVAERCTGNSDACPPDVNSCSSSSSSSPSSSSPSSSSVASSSSSSSLAELGAPSDLTGVQCGKAVCLQWRDNATKEKNFELERSRGGGVPLSLYKILPKNVTSFTDTSMLPGSRTYHYRIRAVNPLRKSPYSNIVQVPFVP